MKKEIVLFLLMPLMVLAKFRSGTIFLNDGTSKNGFLEIPNYDDAKIKFRSTEKASTEKFKIEEVKNFEVINDDNIKVFYETLYLANFKIFSTTEIKVDKNKSWVKIVKQGKITLYYFPRMYERFRQEKQIKKLLENYNMMFDYGFSSCIGMPNGFSNNCYENAMLKNIEKKYGAEFFKTMVKKSRQRFIDDNPNIEFEFEEVDTIARYPNSENYSSSLSNPSDDFNKKFIYPKNYNFKKEKFYSITVAEFTILKNGLIKDLEVESDFENPKNNKFKTHIENGVSNFIKQTKWIPASIDGSKINSKMRVIIEHNKNEL